MSLCVPSISLRTEAGDPTENGCLIRGGVFVWRGFGRWVTPKDAVMLDLLRRTLRLMKVTTG
jgi:hypothetical protein